MCLIFVGKGCQRKIFNGENFVIYSTCIMFVFINCLFTCTCTVNCEYFIVKIFSDSLAYAKIKMRENIHVHVCALLMVMWYIQGRLSENYLTRKFIARNILQMKYL